MWPSKPLAEDGIPGFLLKVISDIFVPVPKHILNPSSYQQNLLDLWKQLTIVPV
jgi:hypothetical protein